MPAHQLGVDVVCRRPRRSVVHHQVSIDLGHIRVGRQALLLDQELHHSFCSPLPIEISHRGWMRYKESDLTGIHLTVGNVLIDLVHKVVGGQKHEVMPPVPDG